MANYWFAKQSLVDNIQASVDGQSAEALRKRAVMVMGKCLEDKTNGLRPWPVRHSDLLEIGTPG